MSKSFHQRIADAVREHEGSEHEANMYHAYSGRGMYGRKCPGVTGSESTIMKVIATAIKEFASEMADELSSDDYNGRTEHEFAQFVDDVMEFDRDSMGRDVIVYWPRQETDESVDAEVVDDAWNAGDGHGE